MKTKVHTIKLYPMPNPQCRGCRNREERESDPADGLCTTTMSVDDGLPVRCVGEWAYDKIYRLVRYFGIFAGGMKNKWTLNYIEICSGPGRCIQRNNQEEIDGTALAILKNDKFVHINKAIFVDHSQQVVDTLNQRIAAIPNVAVKAKAIFGDYNCFAQLRPHLEELPNDSLNLVFIDPTDCSIPFETVREIVNSLRKADLIINVATKTDANRNLINAVIKPSFATAKKKYIDFLGSDAFFTNPKVLQAAQEVRTADVLALFIEEYQKSLRGIGLIHIDLKPVERFYHLMFASANSTGLKFWHEACAIDPDGQRTFKF